jgi:hypothetical protein
MQEEIDSRLAALEQGQRDLRRFATAAIWHAIDRVDALVGAPPVCPICDRSQAREALEQLISNCIFGGGRLERYLCPGCGCIYGPTKFLRLPPDLVAADYAVLYAGYSETDSTANEIRTFHSLRPALGRQYLNWGSGRDNKTIPTLRGKGYDVWGYEPMIEQAENDFIVSRKDEISPGVAGLFSNNVIEHLVRPVEEFQFFHGILGPGARMAHASPCYRYTYEFSRFHVIFYTGDSAQVLAERTGFRLVHREEDGEFINCIFERR